jgi:hypothetical protein
LLEFSGWLLVFVNAIDRRVFSNCIAWCYLRLNEPTEELLSELSVTTRLKLGSEHLRLLFTSNRIVVDHVGKRGAGAVAGSGILGKLSGAFEDLFRSGNESARRRGIVKMSPGQVLRAHRDNFAILYSEVVSVIVEQTIGLNSLTILTGDEKFEFLTRTRFESVIGMVSKTLGDKVTARRLSKSRTHR